MSIAFSLAVVAATADPGRTWIVNQQPRHCVALRARTPERTGVAVRVRPFAEYLDLLLLVPKTGARNAYVPVSLSVPLSRPGSETRARMVESAESTDRVVSIGLSQRQLAAAIAARSITVDAGKRGTFTASLAGAAKLPAALAACADAVAGGLGLSPHMGNAGGRAERFRRHHAPRRLSVGLNRARPARQCHGLARD